MKPWLIILIIVIALITIVGAGYLGFRGATVTNSATPQAPVTIPVTRGDVQQTVTAPGQLAGTREMQLGFEVSGQVADIKVRPGDTVPAGAELARLNTRPLEKALQTARLELAKAETEHARELAQAQLDLQIAEAELEQEKVVSPNLIPAEAALAAAQAELAEILAGPNENEVTMAAAEFLQAEIALKKAQWEYDQVAYAADIGARPEAARLEEATLDYETRLAGYRLAVQGATTAEITNARAKVQQARADYDQALAEQEVSGQKVAILAAQVKKARLALEALQAGVDPSLKRAVESAAEDLRATTLTAPFAGTIVEILAKPGETVLDGAGVILMADVRSVEAWTKVIEEDLPLVQIGQPVEVFFDAVPETVLQGQVARIVPQRLSGEDRPLYPVYITLSGGELPENILPGMTVDASIIITRRAGVLRLPRALVQARSDGRAVIEVWANDQLERREVQVGLRGDVYVEIVAGLREGEQVVGQ
jgi:RND family efflux transporter MFP subunit